MAPIKSAIIDNAAIHIPPNVAAIGIYRVNTDLTKLSLLPWAKVIFSSLSYLATSFTLLPLTYIQTLENNPHVPSIKTM